MYTERAFIHSTKKTTTKITQNKSYRQSQAKQTINWLVSLSREPKTECLQRLLGPWRRWLSALGLVIWHSSAHTALGAGNHHHSIIPLLWSTTGLRAALVPCPSCGVSSRPSPVFFVPLLGAACRQHRLRAALVPCPSCGVSSRPSPVFFVPLLGAACRPPKNIEILSGRTTCHALQMWWRRRPDILRCACAFQWMPSGSRRSMWRLIS